MVAYAYENLGGISGVVDNPRVAYSKRGRDRDRFQNFIFECDSAKPFSGIVHIQGSLDAPPQDSGIRNKQTSPETLTWADVASLEFTTEGGTIFVQFEVEFAHVRAVCRPGNYWSAALGTAGATSSAGEFTINGIGPIVTSGGEDAAAVAALINDNNAIQSDGTIIADATGVNSDELRIYKTDGADLVLVDATGTPLTDMGITPGTFESGHILTIKSMR